MAFMTKRMNRPPKETEFNVTKWENLVEATKALPDLTGRSCVAGIDYAKTSDFVVVGLLFKDGNKYYWVHHTWVCKHSPDLPRIKFPLKEAENEDVLTFVNEVEISPDLIVEWMAEQAKKYIIELVAMDSFRYALLANALKNIGFTPEKKNVRLIRPSDIMKVSGMIEHVFSAQLIIWGTSKIMRWYTWNTKAVTDSKGNTTYEKISPKDRKTDGFMAYVAAMIEEGKIKQRPKRGRRLGTIT